MYALQYNGYDGDTIGLKVTTLSFRLFFLFVFLFPLVFVEYHSHELKTFYLINGKMVVSTPLYVAPAQWKEDREEIGTVTERQTQTPLIQI